MKFFLSFLLVFVSLKADSYKIGQGFKLDDTLHIGGYFSTDYTVSDSVRQYRLDDVALIAYGRLSSPLSYLIELEAAPYYVKDYKLDTTTSDKEFHYERAYLNYNYSEMINIRIGKQITPIGYWNLEPINVLRDTSSNPIYSHTMFPKLLTGIDIFGYLDPENSLKYHIFMQNNKDLDEEYINIPNDHFFGISLGYDVTPQINIGGSLGRYTVKYEERDVDFIQLNAKYDNDPLILQTEWAYNTNNDQLSGYLQALYNFDMHHAIIGRYEYYNVNEIESAGHMAIIGYSFRPIYAVSLKAEYQMNSDSSLSKSIISFSVLF